MRSWAHCPAHLHLRSRNHTTPHGRSPSPVTSKANLVAGGQSQLSWVTEILENVMKLCPPLPRKSCKRAHMGIVSQNVLNSRDCPSIQRGQPSGLRCLLSADPRQEGTRTGLTVQQAEINVTSDKCLNLSFLYFICKNRNTPTPNYTAYKSTCNYHYCLTLSWKF